MYTPPLSARGSMWPNPSARGIGPRLDCPADPAGVIRTLRRSGICLLRNERSGEDNGLFMFSCKEHLGTECRSIECDYEKLHGTIEG